MSPEKKTIFPRRQVILILCTAILAAAPAYTQSYDGEWSGSTAQGKAISFEIVAGKLPTISFGFSAQGAGCSTSGSIETTFTPSRTISYPSFSFSGGSTSPGSVSWNIAGTFASSTAASGTLSFTTYAIPGVGGCSASASTTWSASRAGGPLPEGPAAIIIAVGSVQGSGGSSFRTSAQLHNPGTTTLSGTLVLHPAGVSGSDADPSLPYELGPYETIFYEDFVAAMGQSGLGSLDIVTDEEVPITAFRVFSDGGEAGTSGIGLEPIMPGDALQAGDSGVLLASGDPSRLRTNIGVRTLGDGVSMMITIRDAEGLVRHTLTKTLGADYFNQHKASDFLGFEPGPNDSITFAINSGSAFIYVALTDNRTQDPTLFYAR